MDFCIIAPTAGLERYATLSKTHLVLAHVKNEQYKQFYKQRIQEGDNVILDNGEYEGAKQLEEFEEAIAYYEPPTIVLPDFLHQNWEKTYDQSDTFMERFESKFGGPVSFMYVPQTTDGDLMGWIEGLYAGCDNLRIDYVGLPRALQTHYAPGLSMIRPKTCEFIKRHWPHLKVHALGMVKGDVNELNALRDTGCDSCDSSAPVWRGWNRYHINDPQDRTEWDTAGTECNFDAPIGLPNSEPDRQILLNLELCGVNTNVNTSNTR